MLGYQSAFRLAVAGSLVAGCAAFTGSSSSSRGLTSLGSRLSLAAAPPTQYTIPDQPLRFLNAKKDGNKRYLDIDSVYDGSFLKGQVALVTGGNRGLGLAITEELVRQGAEVIVTSRNQVSIPGVSKVVSGIDVTDNECGKKLAEALDGKKIDIVINNAGYFYEPVEKIDTLNFDEEMKMIDICAVGPLRISSALVNANLVPKGGKIVMITSQGGSVAWRTTQNPTGHDYGHHMSKSAANMMGVLLSQELKAKDIVVTILHPGFNKTGMTKKYEHIWEIEGAVDASVGAKRVCHEIGLMDMSRTGKFINCEDGLMIPW